MAAIDTNRTLATAGIVRQAIEKCISAVATYFEIRATRRALAQLSDRELDDIGLNRGDIEHIGFHH
ncbi:DUF1127 domain-containing protein [Roseovarius sp. CAU 1744]|uniref:DUF1127 domain-containing protein n=1 Tax=Roseovarius sp. CAU 1744 TaxID=3140368 RepID=UPI00325BCE57